MEIIRNKYITIIIGKDIVLKLPTNKYDDIVGIVNNELPDLPEYANIEFENKDKIKYNEYNLLIFNNKKYRFSSLLEFADMGSTLYIDSIYNASSKFEKESKTNLITYLYINKFIIKLIEKFLYGNACIINMPTYADIKFKDIIPNNINDEFTYKVQNPYEIIDYSNIKKVKVFVNKDSIEEIYNVISRIYDDIIKDFILFGENGDKYTISKLNKKEVCYIINKLIIKMLISNNNKLLSSPNININVICDIFLKLKTWKTLELGMMSLKRNMEQEVLVDITNLKCMKELETIKTFGKSFLQTQTFRKKIMN